MLLLVFYYCICIVFVLLLLFQGHVASRNSTLTGLLHYVALHLQLPYPPPPPTHTHTHTHSLSLELSPSLHSWQDSCGWGYFIGGHAKQAEKPQGKIN